MISILVQFNPGVNRYLLLLISGIKILAMRQWRAKYLGNPVRESIIWYGSFVFPFTSEVVGGVDESRNGQSHLCRGNGLSLICWKLYDYRQTRNWVQCCEDCKAGMNAGIWFMSKVAVSKLREVFRTKEIRKKSERSKGISMCQNIQFGPSILVILMRYKM